MGNKQTKQTNQPKMTKPTDEKPKSAQRKPNNTGKEDKTVERGVGKKQ